MKFIKINRHANEIAFLVLWALGGLLLYLYFYGVRPGFLNVSVPAIASTYLEKRYFLVVQTNLLDELAFACFIGGLYALFFLGLSHSSSISFFEEAFYFAVKWSLLLLLVFYFLFYGYVALLALVFGLVVFFLMFYIKYNYS